MTLSTCRDFILKLKVNLKKIISGNIRYQYILKYIMLKWKIYKNVIQSKYIWLWNQLPSVPKDPFMKYI